MKRFLLAALFLLALASPSIAQTNFIGGGFFGDAKVASAGYTGPGDLHTYSTYYSTAFAYDAALRGPTHFIINLCTPSDAHCEDEGTDATTGIISLGTFGATCNNSTVICTIKKYYDITGGGNDATQGTIGNRYVFTVSCIGSLPCGTASHASVQLLTSGSATVLNQPYTVVVAGERTGSTSQATDIFGWSDSGGANAGNIQYPGTSGSIACFAGNTVTETGFSDPGYHVIQLKANGASSDCNIDNTAGTGNAGTNNAGLFVAVGAENYVNSGGLSFNGNFLEGGLSSSTFTAGAVYTNIKTRWGF